jgi:hypothetical protein
MTTLDDYPSERSASRNHDIHIYITVNVPSESRRELYAFKLDMLEKVIRGPRAQGGHASVDAIYYESLLLGIVKSREELADLLRLAEREGRIVQGPCGTWRTPRPWFGGEKRESDDASIDCH